MFNENVLSGKWKQIKGEVQKKWGHLTGDEIDKMKGNITSLSGLVQERYGLAQEEARRQVNEVVSGILKNEDEATRIEDEKTTRN